MKKIEIDLVGEETNAAVLKLSYRRFPGLLIQGDSLSILYHTTRNLVAALEGARIDEARESASEIRDLLSGYVNAYESAMKVEGLELP